jgi:hypothetical protein
MPSPITLPIELLTKIQKAQRRLTDLGRELDKCESCGMEVDKLRTLIGERLQILQALEAKFGPQGPQYATPSASSEGTSQSSQSTPQPWNPSVPSQ